MVLMGLNLSKLVVCLALMAAASSSVSQVTVTVTCFGAYCESCCAVRGKKIEKCLMFSMHFFNDEFGDVTKLLLLRRRTDIVGLKRPTGPSNLCATIIGNPPAKKDQWGSTERRLASV